MSHILYMFRVVIPVSPARKTWWDRFAFLTSRRPHTDEADPSTQEGKLLRRIMGEGATCWPFSICTSPDCVVIHGHTSDVDAAYFAAKLIQAYMNSHSLDHPISFGWSSSPQGSVFSPDDIGGGAFVITSRTIRTMTTWQWIADTAAASQEKKACIPCTLKPQPVKSSPSKPPITSKPGHKHT